MSIDGREIRILVVNGSPRKKNNSRVFVDKCIEGIASLNADVAEFDFAGKTFEHCRESCKNYHVKTGNCIIDDDLHEFAGEWMRADGVIYVIPLFHMGMPSAMNAAITRLGAIVFGHSQGKVARLLKIGGVIAQGNTEYGGQEIVMEYINSHLLLMNCIPVTSDMPESYIGVGARVRNDGGVDRGAEIMESAFMLGVRVVELAKIIKEGKAALSKDLPEEYFYDSERAFHPPKDGKNI